MRARKNRRSSSNLTAELIKAVLEGDMAEIRRLLKEGADPNGAFCVAEAVPSFSVDLGEDLTKEELIERISDTLTPFLIAVSSRKKMELIRLLLDAGADPNIANNKGMTPLMLSTSSHLTRLLLERGAEVNARNKDGMTALMFCTNANVSKLLIQAGARVNLADNEGMTALMLSENAACTKVLLEAGAKPNARNKMNATAIMFAKDMEQINALLAAGAKATVIADRKLTPLHFAAHLDHHRVIPFWLEHFDVNVKDKEGQTPSDFAFRHSNPKCGHLLVRRGGMPSLAEHLLQTGDLSGLIQSLAAENPYFLRSIQS